MLVTPVVATDPAIILIEDSNDYAVYGFNDLGIYYTPESLTSFHMPFIVERTGAFNNLEKYDLDGNYTKKTGSFDKRFISHSFDILAENDGYYVVDFSMKTFASNESFSVDFVPEIKDIEFPEFAWWNSSWNYYRTITINNTKVAADEINLPVLVAINDTIGDKCDGGNSIRFLDENSSTEYNYEIEKWVDGSDRIAWVNVTNVSSSSDTVFLLYYNNSGASDNQTPVGVWDATMYGAVWHSNDASTNLTDSTYTYNTTAVNGTPSYQQTGKVGYCVNYDGSTDYFTYASLGSMLDEATNWTVLAWVNSNEYPAGLRTAWSNWGDYLHTIQYEGNASGDLDLWTTDGTDRTPLFKNTPIINSWYMCTLRWNDTDNSFYSYLNKTYVETISSVGVFTTGGGAKSNTIGALGNDAIIRYWHGEIDELWIMTEDMGSDWITTMYNMMDSPSTFLAFGIETVDQPAPTNFSTTTTSITSINVTWTKGINATHTHIQRKTGSYPTSSTDGTNIYNGTGTFYDDVGLDSYTRFYYRAWGYNSTTGNWSNYASSYNNTGPTNPTSVTGTIVGNDLNISWVMGSYVDTTVIQRKTNSYPTSPTDGTNIYNGTGLYYVDTSVLQTYYYTLFSWDNNTKLHSSGVNLEWGSLVVNCYDEETNNSVDFDILINNEDGSETYESLNNTNSLIIDVNDLPLGDNIRIQISAASSVESKTQVFTGYGNNANTTVTQVVLLQNPNSKSSTNVTTTNTSSGNNSYPQFTIDADIITIPANVVPEFDTITVIYEHDEYKPRTYFRDFATNQLYSLNAYLPNADDSELYRITVEDVYSIPVDDVLVNMKVSVNGTFVISSSVLTNGNGNADIFLLPGTTYLFSITKTRYETTYGTWTPSDIVFTKTFRIVTVAPDITTKTFGDIIVFNAEWITANNTLKINFRDKEDNTTDITFSVYEIYNDTLTLTNRSAFGNISTATLYYLTLNTSRMHRVDVEMNHTTLGHVVNQSIFIGPIRNDSRVDENWLEQKIKDVFGDFDQGYVNFFIVFLPCVILIISLGAVGQPGLGVTGSSLYLFLLSWRVNLNNEHILAIASIMLLFGVIMIIVKNGKKLTGRTSS